MAILSVGSLFSVYAMIEASRNCVTILYLAYFGLHDDRQSIEFKVRICIIQKCVFFFLKKYQQHQWCAEYWRKSSTQHYPATYEMNHFSFIRIPFTYIRSVYRKVSSVFQLEPKRSIIFVNSNAHRTGNYDNWILPAYLYAQRVYFSAEMSLALGIAQRQQQRQLSTTIDDHFDDDDDAGYSFNRNLNTIL